MIRLFFIALIFGSAVAVCGETPLPADVSEYVEMPGPEVQISLDEVTRLALLQDPDVIIAGLAFDALATTVEQAESIYDFNLRGTGRYGNEHKPPPIEFLSTRTKTADFLVGLTKLLPIGTGFDLALSSLRTDEDTAFATLTPRYETAYTIKVKQPLLKNFLGYLDRGQIALVKLDVRRFDYQTLDSIEQSLLVARGAYWDLLEAQESFAAEQAALKSAADFYRYTVEKLPFGLTEEPDVIAADGNLRRYYIRAIIARSKYENRSDTLKAILDLKNEGYLRARPQPLGEEPSINLNETLRAAFERRFDYRSALLNSRAKGLSLKMKTMDLLPRLDFEGTVALNALDRHLGNAAGDAWNARGRDIFVGLSLDTPLENRKARAERQRAAIEKKKALEEIRKVELAIFKEVIVAVRNLLTAYDAARQSERVEVLESEKLDAENKRFAQGRSSSDTIIRFQFDKWEAREFNIESSVAYHQAGDELLRKTNRLIDTVSAEGSVLPALMSYPEPPPEAAP